MKKGYVILRDLTRRLKENDTGMYASGIAFFLFLSLIPILILFCSALPFTPLSEASLMKFMQQIVPESMEAMVVSLVAQVYDRSKGTLPFAVLMTLWSAGKGMLALMRALNAVEGVGEKRGYFHLRLLASFYTVVVLAAVLFTLCIGVFGRPLLHFLEKQSPVFGEGSPLTTILRFLLVLFILSFSFTLIYTYIPNRQGCSQKRVIRNLPGAVFAGAGCNLCSIGFSVYVEYFHPFSAYGSLQTIVIFLLWLYFYCYILLIGANINKYYVTI